MRKYVPHAVLFTLLLTVSVHSDDPVSSSVTFNREVVRIFQRKCFQCHAQGGVGMSLATYREARPWARAIREELVEQRMPPWSAAPGYTPLAHDAGLTAREMAMLLTWLDGGVPRGEERDFPRNVESAAPSSRPDLLLTLPAQAVPADDEHVVRRVTIPAAKVGGRPVQRLELRGVDRRVLRGAMLWTTSPAGRQWIGAWTPWQDAVSAPAGSAFAISDDATLDIELHYRGREADQEDRPSLGVFYAPARTASFVRDIRLQAGSDERSAPRRTTGTLSAPARVWAIAPDRQTTAASAGSLEITARMPDGVVQVLLWVPHYRHDWPTPYMLREPVSLPAGTTVTLTTSIDGLTAASVVATQGDGPSRRSVLR